MGKLGKNLFPIAGACLALLFEFHDAPPDLPVSGGHQCIDRARSRAAGGFEQLGDATEQAAIFFRRLL